MATPSSQKSTIVRSLRAARSAMVRAAFRTLGPIAPGLAARWAVRIWATPPPWRARRPDLAAAPGDRFMITLAASPRWASRPIWRPGRSRQFAVPVTGHEMVVAETWGDGPVVYLLHGWGGRRTQLGSLVEPLVAAGHRVVALDAPGHGESGPGRHGGRRTTLVEFAQALASVVAVTGPAHAVVAHSAGSAAAALAVRDGLAAGRLVFLAPVADPLPYVRHLVATLGLGRRGWARFRPVAERMAGRDLAELDLPARAAEAAPGRLPPLLVVHDRTDRETRYADGCAIAAAWPGATLRSTDGLGHRRLLGDPEVVDATVSFVTEGAGNVRLVSAAGSTARS